MSSQAAADMLRTLTPFAKAIVDLGEHVEVLASLDSGIAAKRKELSGVKSEHAAVVAGADDAKRQAQADRDKLQQDLAAARSAHDDDLAQQRTAFDAEKHDQLAAIDQIRATHDATVQKTLDDARVQAASIISEANDTAAKTRIEYADIVPKLETARAEYAKAKGLLDEINAKIDSHRAQ